MKLIYSELKKFLPDLAVKPEQLRDDITMIGHFTNYFEEIDGEIVFDLDIKVNRGDALGYYGIARDLSVLYNIPLILPEIKELSPSNYQLPITVSTDKVKRVMALKISGLKNSISPKWLQTFVKCHGSKPINTLVDLSNYIMFLYGIPNHAFDTTKSTDNLIWEINSKYSEFISLDGTKLELNKNILMINNPNQALSLCFWGGEACAIDLNTTETIIEMAVYNRTTVRQNSRQLKAVTEAGIRLEKDLDPELIPLAFKHFLKLILENCGGKISSQTFDYYPSKLDIPSIEFDPKKVSTTAGIDIPVDFSTKTLKALGCNINNNLITPPSIRKDITLEADLIEEVIRFWGYQKIPTNEVLPFKEVTDITPKIIYLIDELKDKLVELGYDEVLTWPLVNKYLDPKTVVTTQNSINSEYIYLRQSLIQSLKIQLDQYQRFKLPSPQFFEIGRIFSQENGQYIERTSLGIYNYNSEKLLSDLKSLNLTAEISENNFVEINLDNLPKPEKYIPKILPSEAVELTSQIITLDANLTLDTQEEPISLIKKYSALIDEKILWSMEITDIYHDEKLNKYRYTFQVSYYNCDDKTAKKIHLSTFGLTNEKYNYIDPKSETKLLYYEDMYLSESTANIINIKTIDNQKYLILDQTIFFPEGGGQPSDTGIISKNNQSSNVISLKYKDNQVLHLIDSDNFEIGDKVNLKINWENRYKYMKIHSAGHLLHEALMEIDPSLIAQKGYHHDNAYLIYQGKISQEKINSIEIKLKELIIKNLPILCDYTDIETLSKDALSVPKNLPLNKKLRRLKIGNYPSMADGGIQVKSTQEIGDIKITSIENLPDNQVKINYQVL